MNKDKSKGIILHKTLLQSCSTEEDKSKVIIVNKTLLQSCSTDEDELCYTEEDKPECAIRKQKDAKNEVTYDLPSYFNASKILECGRRILDRLDMSYEITCMATQRAEYFTKMLYYLLEHKHRHNTPLSSKNLQEAVRRVTEEEEKYAKRNVNNVTTFTLFQSPIAINAQNKDANVKNERKIASGIHEKTIKEFKGCTIQ